MSISVLLATRSSTSAKPGGILDDFTDIFLAEEGEALQPDTSNSDISDLLRQGQEILVQVVKDPIGTKGARLTTHISLPGRFLVYLPNVRQHRCLAPHHRRR